MKQNGKEEREQYGAKKLRQKSMEKRSDEKYRATGQPEQNTEWIKNGVSNNPNKNTKWEKTELSRTQVKIQSGKNKMAQPKAFSGIAKDAGGRF